MEVRVMIVGAMGYYTEESDFLADFGHLYDGERIQLGEFNFPILRGYDVPYIATSDEDVFEVGYVTEDGSDAFGHWPVGEL